MRGPDAPGDYLRDTHRLTGTHLGCEHGVCGACTVLVDDKPVRSCITFAAACQGADIVTVEGYEDDPVMADLRAAFNGITRCSAATARPGCWPPRAISWCACPMPTKPPSATSCRATCAAAPAIWASSPRSVRCWTRVARPPA
ncbi:protein of unknown function (plasmid) [Cupriavidus taiwanensis]|nr:protein of unknown function [Cupriavidus taiwanensis]